MSRVHGSAVLELDADRCASPAAARSTRDFKSQKCYCSTSNVITSTSHLVPTFSTSALHGTPLLLDELMGTVFSGIASTTLRNFRRLFSNCPRVDRSGHSPPFLQRHQSLWLTNPFSDVQACLGFCCRHFSDLSAEVV